MLAAQVAREHNMALRAEYLHRARLRRRDATDSERADAPKPRTIARQQLRRSVTPIAKDMAVQTHAQVTRALGVAAADAPVDLGELTYGFVDSMVSLLEGYPLDATTRVASAFEEWSSLAAEDRDVDALSTMLDLAFDGAEGTLQNSLRMLYGETFADMNKAVQTELNGDNGYFWACTHDAVLRPEHAACENVGEDEPYYFSDEPPLSAEDSSSGEACYPGEDYNCRCIAVPALPNDSDQVSES